MRLGIDVGGSKCLVVGLGGAGDLIYEDRRPTPPGSELVDLLAELVEVARTVEEVQSVGLGIAGLVTPDGVVRAAANLTEIDELPIRQRLTDRLGLAVAVDNDNTCATYAEWRSGAGVGHSDLLYVGLGTGIGGGIVMDGALRRGAHGFAGEIGHMLVDRDGPACPCGRRGCWERFASGSAMGERARRLLGPEATAADLLDAASSGEVSARAEVDEFARWVAVGLMSLTNVLDPDVIVLGGGLGSVGPVLFTGIGRWLERLLYAPEHRPHPVLVPAAFGARSGAYGAALLAET